MDNLIAEFKSQIRAAITDQTILRIRAGGSKDWYGQAIKGEVLDASKYCGIIDYEPSELVMTARAGTTLTEIEATLAEHHQMLAFEPPHWGDGATLGGTIAAGLCGPRRWSAGPIRDYLLGVSVLDGRAQFARYGGKVMKNVAGFDVSRTFAGSMGTLGLMLDVSVKVMPRPQTSLTLVLAMSAEDANLKLLQWQAKGFPLSASFYHVGFLYLRLCGSTVLVNKAKADIGGEAIQDMDEANAFWVKVREHKMDFFTQDEDEALWRIALPPNSPSLSLTGKFLVEWGGQLRWLITRENPTRIRNLAAQFGGHATLFRGGDKDCGVFQRPDTVTARIQNAIQQVFDPFGIFQNDRLYEVDSLRSPIMSDVTPRHSTN